MTYRMLELIAPQETINEAREIAEKEEILASWIHPISEKESILRVLLDTDRTESISDILVNKFEKEESFRIMLFEVEATLPYPGEEGKEPKAEEKGDTYVGRISREELYSDITQSSELNHSYIGLVILSTFVAVVGLLTNDVVIIIGSMVIAPLLGPNIAMTLAVTLGDLDLGRRALKTNATGLLISFLVSLVMGYILVVNPESDQLVTRSSATFTDIVVALAAGSAGVLAFTRGASAAIIGVMVAVALLPPLVSFGLFLGGGFPRLSLGALILTVTNLIGINLAGVTTFLLQGIRPRTWWKKQQAKDTTWWVMALWILLMMVFVIIIWLWSENNG